MRARGADIVLISAHGGDSGTSSYGPELPNENPVALIAEQVPGIDAILFGHAHSEVPQRFVTNTATGVQVLLSEPSKWGQRLTRMDFTAQPRARPVDRSPAKSRHHAEHQHGGRGPGGARGRARPSTPRPSRTSTRSSPRRPWSCRPPSRGTRTPRSWTTSTTCRPTTVTAALAGTAYAGLPVLSIAAPFSRTAVFPPGDVKIRDVAGPVRLRQHPRGGRAHRRRGAGLPGVLGEVLRDAAGRAPRSTRRRSATRRVPDYNYDVISGVDYDIDISQAGRPADHPPGPCPAPTPRSPTTTSSWSR